MKRLLAAILATAVLSFLAPADVVGQIGVFVGAGMTAPTADFAEFPGEVGNGGKPGWQAFGGVLVPVGEAGLSVGGEIFYGVNNHDLTGDKTNLYGGMGLVGFAFGEPDAVSPFVFGGLGALVHDYRSEMFPIDEEKFTGLAAGGGGGVSFPLGTARCMVAGSYNQGMGDVSDTSFFGASAAVQFQVGND